MDEMGNNALILAACYGRKQIVNFLIQQNADVNIANKHGETALIWAADKGHKEIVKTLILNQANLYAINHFGQPAIYWAKLNGHLEIVRILEKAMSQKVLPFPNLTKPAWGEEFIF
jgi:ankyrin repeat protein